MVKAAGVISQYRERLDKTLASPELKSFDSIKALVRNQLLNSSINGTEECGEKVLEKKTSEVSNFLDMLRSASVETSHSEWKLKDDNEDYRVMYRPGPQGTPLHTLLVEGYVDGPVDKCLCVSWESALYKKWWPQFNFPPFKILVSECLKEVRIGEQISLVRVKVMWPLSCREVVVHYLLFEYFKDDLIVVLLNSISDLKCIDVTSHGFAKDGIPEAEDVVRIDVVGGFALQKVTSERSYFRTIANMDLKLDFVPPSLINFISRQLIGSGFSLYKKVVNSLSKDDADYSKALENPLYARIREALYSASASSKILNYKELQQEVHPLALEQAVQKDRENAQQILVARSDASESSSRNRKVNDSKACGENEEEKNKENKQLDNENSNAEVKLQISNQTVEGMQYNEVGGSGIKSFGEIEEEESNDSRDTAIHDRFTCKPPPYKNNLLNNKTNVAISPEVQQALQTLENAISFVRNCRLNAPASSPSSSIDGTIKDLENHAYKDSISAERGAVCSTGKVSIEASNKEHSVETNPRLSENSSSRSEMRRLESNSQVKDANPNRVAPASSPEQSSSLPDENNQVAITSKKGNEDAATKQVITTRDNEYGIQANSFQGRKKSKRQKRRKNCCFFFAA